MKGADVIMVPTASLSKYDISIINNVIPARAIESSLHIVYINHPNPYFNKFKNKNKKLNDIGITQNGGRSCVIAPNGDMLGKAGIDDTLFFVNIIPNHYFQIKNHTPYLNDAKFHLYNSYFNHFNQKQNTNTNTNTSNHIQSKL